MIHEGPRRRALGERHERRRLRVDARGADEDDLVVDPLLSCEAGARCRQQIAAGPAEDARQDHEIEITGLERIEEILRIGFA